MRATCESATCCPDASVSGRLRQQRRSLAGLLAAAHQDRRAAAVFQRGADRPALDLGAQRVGDRVHRQAEAPGLHPVDRDRIILRAFVERRVHVFGAIDAGQDRRQPGRDLVELRNVGAEDLDRHVAAHAADHLLHAHVDRLGEAERQAGKFGEHLAELLQQRGLV